MFPFKKCNLTVQKTNIIALRHLIEFGPVFMWLVLSMHINWWIILPFLIRLAENKTQISELTKLKMAESVVLTNLQ